MAAGVSVALASCTKNEVDVPQSIGGDKEITFALPVVSPSSRAVAETGTGYAVSGSETQAKYDFGVWAKYYADNATDVKWSAGQFYIGKSDANDHGVTAKYQSDLKGWGFETPYYWPKNGSLSFIAYAPASASTTATVTTNGIQFTDYTVSDNADVDLLFSEITRNQKKDKIDTTDPYHGIQIAFNHALSSIRFKVNTDENYEGTTIKVQKIEILNAYSQGDFNQGLDDTNDATTKEVATHNGWSGHATEKTYTAFTVLH